MKLSQRVLFNRITSGMLSILLVVGTVLNPVTMLPAFATASFVKLNYENHDKNAVELYVQAEEVNYKPGDEMELTLYVQNNSEEALSGVGLSWNGDEDAFEEAEFIGYEELEAELNDKGNVVNLNLEAGEIVSLGFVGTLADDLEDLNRGEISFFYGAETESGANVTDRTNFEFTVGLFNELSMEFTDGNELALGETSTIDVKLSLNDLGYYYEAGVEEEEIVEVATDSNTIVATDSNTEIVTASDSDAEVATDSNTEDAVEIASDSDSEEEEDDDEYVFEITDIELNMDTYGAKFKNAKVKHATVADGKAEVEATIEFEMDDDVELGEYFGTLQAAITSDKKVYNAEIGFQYEVVDELITTGFKKHGLFTAELDNFTVNVQVPKGAFDEKVELSVTELATDSEEFKEAEEAMANHDRQYDGMMALDICFLNDDGEEVEPKEGYNVQVSIEMNAEVLPEGTDTESLMVHHIAETTTDDVQTEVELVVEDVADTADATAGLVEVKEADEAPVVAAEFEVEGFSTFTITWVNGKTITVKYVTSDGTELNFKGAQTGQVTANSSFDIRKFALSNYVTTNNETYSFVKAVFNNTYEYANVEDNAIEWSTEEGLLQYYANNVWNDITADSTLNLVYAKIEPGATFKGEDTSGLINIHMKDFEKGTSWDTGNFKINNQDRAINNWTGTGAGVYQGIVDEKLGSDGYPALDEKHDTSKRSLKKYFSDGTTANYLFQIDEKGYYYYDSDLNAAYLNTSKGEFGLYATPHATGNFDSGAEPQFMPYHKMSASSITRGSGNSRYQYYPYLNSSNNSIGAEPSDSAANYYFGMYVSFDFIMPKDGKVAIKDPAGNILGYEEMVFEFNGDDDVWVFIDDQLVLDLGGVHLSSGGDINFATGEITVDRVSNNNNQKQITTFTKYADYSSHTLKFFYMERGAGGSNCKLRFNLQAIPEGTINFEKELGYVNVADASDIEFLFNAYVDYDGTDNGENYELYTGAYELYNDANDQVPAKTISGTTDGCIKLKDGQMARLINTSGTLADKKISAKSKFYIKEIGATSDKYNVVINGVSVDSSTNNGAIQNNEGVTSNKFVVGSNPYVKFKNNIAADNQFNLRIHKDLSSGADTTTEFKFNVLLGLLDKELYKGEYYVYDASGTLLTQTPLDATNGVIILKAGQFAEIRGLMGGNTIEVVEDISELSNSYTKTPTYEIEAKALKAGTKDINGKAKGTALEGIALTNALKDANGIIGPINVTITNHPSTTAATVSKRVVGNMADVNKLFTFTATLKDSNGASLKFPMPNDGDLYTLSTDGYTATFNLAHDEKITIDGLPVGSELLVTEHADGYTTYYQVGSADQVKEGNPPAVTVATDTSDDILFINEKNAIIDTGISMDTLPYILILLAVIGGVVFTVIRKRKDDDLD